MKKIFLWTLLIIQWTLIAQVQVNLTVNPHPSPKISDWQNRTETAMLSVTNTHPNMEGVSYKISAKLYLESRLLAETVLTKMPVYTLPLGTDTHFVEDIIPFNALIIHENPGERQNIIRTGMLPAGNYRFCVKLVDLNGQVISTPPEVCAQMIITDYQLPELLLPFDQQIISANNEQNIIFRWTPLSPAPPAQLGVKYLLTVKEVQRGQSPEQAFISNQPVIEKEVIGLTQYYMLNSGYNNPPLPGANPKKYVWSVKTLQLDGTLYGKANNGFSPFFTYTVKPDVGIPNSNGSDLNIPVNEKFFAGEKGEFEIAVKQWKKNNGKYSGTGTVFINWLKTDLKVEFREIELDSVKKLKSGKVYVQMDPAAVKYPKYFGKRSGGKWSNDKILNFADWMNNQPGRNYTYKTLSEQKKLKYVPFAMNVDNEKLMVTEIGFSGSSAFINVVARKSLPVSWGLKDLGFFGYRILFHPDGLIQKKYHLRLVEDLNIVEGGKDKVEFHFKASKGNKTDGCLMTFAKDSVTYTGVVNAKLPVSWMYLAGKKTKEPTEISLKGTYKNWNGIILEGTLPKSTIPDSEGLNIEAKTISLDFSDISNPDKMSFPSGYPNQNKHFMGFYAKSIEVELPEAWKMKDAEKRVKFSADNFIIDKRGVSVDITGRNIVGIKKGKVADMSGTVDEAHIIIKMNKFVDAWVRGRLVLPISDGQKENNYLKYKALFHVAQKKKDATKLFLAVTPGKINVEMLEGKMDLNKNSSIVASLGTDKIFLNIDLNGKFYWEKEDAKKDDKDKNFLEVKFQHVGLKYDTGNKKKPFEFKAGSWSLASPQKKVKGFPVSLKKIYYKQKLPQTTDQVLNGELRFDAVFNLSKEIGGLTTFGLGGHILKTPDGFKPEFDKFGISKVKVNYNSPAVAVKASLDLFDKDPVYGDGFKTEADVNFKALKLTAKSLIQFGNTNYNNPTNRFYRYWRVEALMTFPPPGIPFLPGVAFRGFGGGAYANMEPIEKKITGKKVITFKPKDGDWGFKATAVIATTPKDEVFNGDVTVKAHVTQHHGLSKIGFLGQFYVGAGINKRSSAQAKGKINVDYDFPNEHFNMGANLSFNLKLAKASDLNFEMDIKGKTGDWFIKLGEPKDMNTVTLFPKTPIKRDVSEYLMVGNKIPTATGFSNKFKSAYKDVVGEEPGFKSTFGEVNKKAATGQGFSFGVNFTFKTDGNIRFENVSLWGYYPAIYYDIAAGAELFGSLLEYKTGCAGYNPVGINGWRAQAGVGVYGKIDIAGKVYKKEEEKKSKKKSSKKKTTKKKTTKKKTTKKKTKKKNNDKEVYSMNLINLRVGAWVQGEFPKPSYVAGRFQGKVKFMFWDIKFDEKFTYGTSCKGLKNDKGETIKHVDVLTKVKDNKLIESISPKNNLNGMPVDAPITVKYGFVPGEVFSLSEQQIDGSIKSRTFRLAVKTQLKVDKFNTLTTVETTSMLNNLGEYEYRPKHGANNNQDWFGSGTVDLSGQFGLGFSNGAVYPPNNTSGNPQIGQNAHFGNGQPANNGNTYQGGEFPGGPSPYENKMATADYFKIMFSQINPQNSISAVPQWESAKNYFFTVEAELQELKNNKWVRAGSKFYEKRTIRFTTQYVQPGNNMINYNE